MLLASEDHPGCLLNPYRPNRSEYAQKGPLRPFRSLSGPRERAIRFVGGFKDPLLSSFHQAGGHAPSGELSFGIHGGIFRSKLRRRVWPGLHSKCPNGLGGEGEAAIA